MRAREDGSGSHRQVARVGSSPPVTGPWRDKEADESTRQLLTHPDGLDIPSGHIFVAIT